MNDFIYFLTFYYTSIFLECPKVIFCKHLMLHSSLWLGKFLSNDLLTPFPPRNVYLELVDSFFPHRALSFLPFVFTAFFAFFLLAFCHFLFRIFSPFSIDSSLFVLTSCPSVFTLIRGKRNTKMIQLKMMPKIICIFCNI